eukprot:4220635-Amphidinium_carterae.2
MTVLLNPRFWTKVSGFATQQQIVITNCERVEHQVGLVNASLPLEECSHTPPSETNGLGVVGAAANTLKSVQDKLRTDAELKPKRAREVGGGEEKTETDRRERILGDATRASYGAE